MEKKGKENKIIIPKDHRLVTRRDFLSHGLIAGAGMMIGPSLFDLESIARAAADCGGSLNLSDIQKANFITMDHSGGWNSWMQFVVGGQGGQNDFLATGQNPLESYNTNGIIPEYHPSVLNPVSVNGLLFHANSAFLRGMQSTASAATLANVTGGLIIHRSADDTGDNVFNISHLVAQSKLTSALVSPYVGRSNSESGGRSALAYYNPAFAHSIISGPASASSFVNTNLEPFLTNASTSKISKMADMISKVSKRVIAGSSNSNIPSSIKEILSSCVHDKTVENVNQFTPEVLNPNNDNLLKTAFGLTENQNFGNNDLGITATTAKLVLDGIAGCGTAQFGGFDYHNQNFQNNRNRDFDAGARIGSLLQFAANSGKHLMINLISDGGISCNGTVVNYTIEGQTYQGFQDGGDSGARSINCMLAYSPGAPASILKTQIGHARAGATAEQNANVAGNSVINSAHVVLANFLAYHGCLHKLKDLIGANSAIGSLSAAQLQQYLIWDPAQPAYDLKDKVA